MRRAAALLLALALRSFATEPPPLAGTEPLAKTPDRSANMLDGIGRWLERETLNAETKRAALWKAGTALDPADRGTFLFERYTHLEKILGLNSIHDIELEDFVDPREKISAQRDASYSVERVRWPTSSGVHGEGLLYSPRGKARAGVVVLPDVDQIPETSQTAFRLARQGCQVLVPILTNRTDRFSGNRELGLYTNEPAREWIYRQAFDLGQTIVGYEVEKVASALTHWPGDIEPEHLGLVGEGEGGLIALHTAALWTKYLRATLVSGYFGPRRDVYREPIYRNLFGIQREFGDAELAALIVEAGPGGLLVEPSSVAPVSGPPPAGARLFRDQNVRAAAAPGAIVTPPPDAVRAEVQRAQSLVSRGAADRIQMIEPANPKASGGSPAALRAFLKELGIVADEKLLNEPDAATLDISGSEDRQRQNIKELEQYTQSLIPVRERERQKSVWANLQPGPGWDQTRAALRDRLWRECIGKIEAPRLPLHPRSRLVRDRPKWSAYEVELDVFPDVIAWGWLLVPKDLQPGERRPVVVCQHGLDGLPSDTVDDDAPGFRFYKAYAARLCEQGYIVYAPHNPYRGKDKFRELQRRANPLGLSLFSFILAQHEATLDWLDTLPFVDPDRIAFYGLSYGGKTAMRVPALLDRYCLSICSGDFNEWIRKMALDDAPFSYVFTPEYEMYEWNLAAVANYAEMAMLIAPRPFMVERGHDDVVAVDEWVGYEYAKVLHGYAKLKIADRTEIDWFDGPHTIHGVATFDFLRRHLHWPPAESH